jgi:hypothetical protein
MHFSWYFWIGIRYIINIFAFKDENDVLVFILLIVLNIVQKHVHSNCDLHFR